MPVALLFSTGAVGGFLIRIISERLISDWNTTVCWWFYALVAAASMAVVWFTVKDYPEEIGECKDGYAFRSRHSELYQDRSETGKREIVGSNTAAPKERRFFRDRNFYFMGIVQFVNRSMMNGFTTYLALFGMEKGMSITRAALGISIYSMSGLVGRLLSGVADKLPFRKFTFNTISYFFILAGIAMVLLAGNFGSYAIGCGLYGIGIGVNFTLFPVLIPEVLDEADFSALYGIFNAAAGVGSTVIPLVLHVIADRTGHYSLSYLVLGVMAVPCIVLSLVLGKNSGGMELENE